MGTGMIDLDRADLASGIVDLLAQFLRLEDASLPLENTNERLLSVVRDALFGKLLQILARIWRGRSILELGTPGAPRGTGTC